MDRYTMETLKTVLCTELDIIARRGINSHQDLDITKDLLESLRNLEEIEKNSMNNLYEMGMGADMRKYSQRGNNYKMGDYSQGNSYNYYDGNSYARGNGGNPDGNSNRYYDSHMDRGYSGASKHEVVEELHQMVKNTSDEDVKKLILDCISKMEK